jgi:hypothetical protein
VNCQALRRELASQPFSSVRQSFHCPGEISSQLLIAKEINRRTTADYEQLDFGPTPPAAEILRTTQRALFELPVSDHCYLGFHMSSTGKVVYGSSLRRWTLMIIILCAVVWRASADALAQDAAPTGLRITAYSTSWSPERSGSNKAPYLVIVMADRWDTPLYGSFRITGDEATNSSAGNTIVQQVGQAASANRTEQIEFGRLVLSSLVDRTVGVRGLTTFLAEPTSPRQTIQRSPDLTGAKVYSLLYDNSAPGSFLYGYLANYLPSKQWLTDSDSYTHEKSSSVRPRSGATSRTSKQAAAVILIIAISRSSHAN